MGARARVSGRLCYGNLRESVPLLNLQYSRPSKGIQFLDVTKIPICQSRNQVATKLLLNQPLPPSLILSCATTTTTTTTDDPEGFVAHCAQSCSSFVTKLRSDPAGMPPPPRRQLAFIPGSSVRLGRLMSFWVVVVVVGFSCINF